ncbi:hypothetical protein [Sinomonas halotolerans]|uniref:Transposase n=1 Tax=Sinomonas halotolerans TaxID=1644133 RepID=A0ABU9WY35_9MICC
MPDRSGAEYLHWSFVHVGRVGVQCFVGEVSLSSRTHRTWIGDPHSGQLLEYCWRSESV